MADERGQAAQLGLGLGPLQLLDRSGACVLIAHQAPRALASHLPRPEIAEANRGANQAATAHTALDSGDRPTPSERQDCGPPSVDGGGGPWRSLRWWSPAPNRAPAPAPVLAAGGGAGGALAGPCSTSVIHEPWLT